MCNITHQAKLHSSCRAVYSTALFHRVNLNFRLFSNYSSNSTPPTTLVSVRRWQAAHSIDSFKHVNTCFQLSFTLQISTLKTHHSAQPTDSTTVFQPVARFSGAHYRPLILPVKPNFTKMK